jgi:hypothetical protein
VLPLTSIPTTKKCLKKVLLSSKVDKIPKSPSFQPCGTHKLKNQRKRSSQSFLVVRRLCEKWLAENVQKL